MPKNPQHTPGPWLVENILNGGPRVVHGTPDGDGFRDDVKLDATTEGQANADLQAAAPAFVQAWALVPREIKDRIFDALHDEGWQEKAIEKVVGRV